MAWSEIVYLSVIIGSKLLAKEKNLGFYPYCIYLARETNNVFFSHATRNISDSFSPVVIRLSISYTNIPFGQDLIRWARVTKSVDQKWLQKY